MRYRRSTVRYSVVVRSDPPWSSGDLWPSDRVRLLVQGRWRPDADTYETPTTVEIVVDVAGVDEDDIELQLFEDALVVQGHRHLPADRQATVYHAASIRQGPFRLELPLPASIDPERVEGRYERGVLRISLHKRTGAS
jgi:HSP20 family protein